MNIATALKTKNRLAGKLRRLRERINELNSQGGRESDKIDPAGIQQLWTQSEELREQLARLKGSIVVATAPIAVELARLAELKALLTSYASLNMRDADIDYSGEKPVTNPRTIFITAQRRVEMIEETQAKIDQLQDRIDSFNAQTMV